MRILLAIAFAACAHKAAPTSPIGDAPQLVTAVVTDWTSTRAMVRLWKRDGDKWVVIEGPSWAGIGTNGAAWGDGLHGNGAPAGRTGPIKQEGDKKSPAGVFALTAAFGYEPQQSLLPFIQLDANTKCIDDVTSSHYGEIGDLSGDFKSFEKMRRDDKLYSLGLVVDHNHAHVPGRGSCIFIHVWSDFDATTVGCTALDKLDLTRLVHEVAPGAVFVLLPRDEYSALSKPWGLPAQ